jgi:excisionase family DNA binding protein
MQGVANSKVPVLPVVHMAQVVGTAAMFVVIGVVAGAVVMLIIRWRRWTWTCGMPLLAAAPFAGMLGWRAAVCYDACTVATVGGGVWRHLVDLRAGGDLAELARDRVGPMTPIRRWRGWRRLLTAGEVAELLRLPVSTIYDLARTGRLPHLKIGRALRFSRSDRARAAARGCGGRAAPALGTARRCRLQHPDAARAHPPRLCRDLCADAADELRLKAGARIAYVFDTGDDWRVLLTLQEQLGGGAPVRRVVERRGTAPPQYPALDAE